MSYTGDAPQPDREDLDGWRLHRLRASRPTGSAG